MDKEPIHPGLVIPQAKSRIPGFKTLRRIIAVCNALLKLRVKVPFVNNLGQVSIGDAKVTINPQGGVEVDLSQVTAPSGGGNTPTPGNNPWIWASPREYSKTKLYSIGEVVVVGSQNQVVFEGGSSGLWVCCNTPTVVNGEPHRPIWPPPGFVLDNTANDVTMQPDNPLIFWWPIVLYCSIPEPIP